MVLVCLRKWFCCLLLTFVSCTCLAQPPAAVFADRCGGCHTIGGGAGAGPDLKDVTKRRDRAWLVKFIQNSSGLIAAKDPTALALQKESSGMEMPAFPNLGAGEIAALLDYLAQESAGASQPAEAQVTITPAAIALGRQLFTGERLLARGGAACISCHTVRSLGTLGGGRLGPDLSLTYERLGKARGLAGWLSVMPTAVMAASFKKNPLTPEEATVLTGFLQEVSGTSLTYDRGRDKFVAIAALCTVMGFVVIGGVWRNRLRGIRVLLQPKRGDQ